MIGVTKVSINKACRLCLKGEKLSNSHIIPEFFFKRLYTDEHYFFELSTDERIKNKIVQKGLREKLMCSRCENHLNKHEKYVAEVFQGTSRLQMARVSEKRILLTVDYAKFKLFALSLLWRASVSSLDFFSAIDLGEEDPIRIMLLTENPGEPEKYGSFLIVPLFAERIPIVDMMVSPDCSIIEGGKVYSFAMGGCLWVVNGSKHAVPQRYQHFFLQRDGQLNILFEDAENIPMLSSFLKRLAATGKTGKALEYIEWRR